MDMNDFMDLKANKFLIVLGKMHASVFGNVSSHLKELGFNTNEFLILYAIAANGPLTIQDIAARIAVTSGNMTYTVDKLENKGLIKRVPCDQDRRKIFIDFTGQGNHMWHQAIGDHMAYLEDMFKDIDEDTLDQTIQAMKLIGKTIG